MRKVYLGDPPGIEKRLFDDIAAAKRDHAFFPVVVVVPGNLVGVYLRRSLARQGGSHCGVRFLTLADLAAEWAEESPHYMRRPTMPFCGEEWLASLTAREAAGGYFGPVAECSGFGEALRQTFRELEDAGLERIPLPQGGDPRRLAELQRLYERYREMRKPFMNRGAAFAAAASARPPSPFMLALYGLYRLTALEREFLVPLVARNGAAVYWQEHAPGFAPVEQLLDWLREQEFTVEHLPPSPDRGDNLAHLQEYLFKPAPGVPPPGGGDRSLEFICAPDEIAEVEEITRGIVGLARSGMRFGEMAVFYPGAAYAGLLRERLLAAGIPCYLAGGLPLAQTRVGRSFLLLLGMIGSDYPRPGLMELLTYAPFDYSGVLDSPLPAKPAFWDHLTVEAGVIKGRRQWRETLEGYRRRLQAKIREGGGPETGGEGPAREHLQQLDLLLSFLGIFFRMMERLAAVRSWADLSAAAGELLEGLFDHGEEQGALLHLLRRLRRLDECGGEFALKPALGLLKTALRGAALPRGKFQQEGINLLPLGSAAGLRFPAIFIPGLAEKIIPTPVRPDPLLPEAERLSLSVELPPRRHALELEALWFTLALGGAMQKAVLTWPRTAAGSSREQLPSFFLSRCGEALCAVRPGYDQLSRLPGYRYIDGGSGKGAVADPVAAVEYDLGCCQRLTPSQQHRYYRQLSPLLGRLLEADRSRFHHRWSAHEGLLTGEVPRALLQARLERAGGVVSATALEDYARCPFSYFMKRLLGLIPLDEPESLLSMTPLTRGRLLHRILEEFYSSASQRGLLPAESHPEDCRALLRRVCREHCGRVPPEERPPYALLWQLQRRTLEETLEALLDWEIGAGEGFIPTGFEVPFGLARCGGEAVSLNLPSGEILHFRGCIDRVDRRGGRLRVIDYKTGRKRFKDESLAGGESLQLPVYLLAARRIYGSAEMEAAEAYAYHLSPEGVKTVLFSGDDWPRKELLLREVLQIIYGGIAAGHFFPYPNQSCRYCDYRPVCGPEIEKIFRHKAGDPLLDPFNRLKEDHA